MKRIVIDNDVPSHWHFAIKLDGWWFYIDFYNLVRVHRAGNSFFATVYDPPSQGWGDRDFKMQGGGRTVLGVYRTIEAAREAAVARVQCEKLPRVCTWADVVAARRDIRREQHATPPAL